MRTLPAIETVVRQSDFGYIDGSYDDLVASIGEIVDQESIGSYQGDYLYLIRAQEGWGFAVVGYGSCSGCDSYQACSTLGELDELRSSIYSGIRWGEDADAMLDLLETTDWKGQWYHDEDRAMEFVSRCKQRMLDEGGGYPIEELLAASDYLEDTEAQRREGPIAFAKAARALRRMARGYQDKKST